MYPPRELGVKRADAAPREPGRSLGQSRVASSRSLLCIKLLDMTRYGERRVHRRDDSGSAAHRDRIHPGPMILICPWRSSGTRRVIAPIRGLQQAGLMPKAKQSRAELVQCRCESGPRPSSSLAPSQSMVQTLTSPSSPVLTITSSSCLLSRSNRRAHKTLFTSHTPCALSISATTFQLDLPSPPASWGS